MSDRDSEAAHWFARMRASKAEADRTEFEAWRADPDNAAAYARAEDDWLLVGDASPEAIAVHRTAQAIPQQSNARWALAAALVLAITLGFAWMFLGHGGGEPVVADNQTGEVILEDGTRVALMEGAKIEHRYDAQERRVILVGGRARFIVAHDPSRPFRVTAAGSVTTALGTIFEIDLRGAEPVVHLVKGSVEVRATARPDEPLLLHPGERATVTFEGPHVIRAAVSGEVPMQRPVSKGDAAPILIADELPLGAVLDRANRVNALQIEVADPGLAGRPVSGRFDVSDAASLSRKLGAALNLAVEDHGGHLILMAKIKN